MLTTAANISVALLPKSDRLPVAEVPSVGLIVLACIIIGFVLGAMCGAAICLGFAGQKPAATDEEIWPVS